MGDFKNLKNLLRDRSLAKLEEKKKSALNREQRAREQAAQEDQEGANPFTFTENPWAQGSRRYADEASDEANEIAKKKKRLRGY